RRVGVAATSQKAIHNLLHEVEEVAHGCGFSFRGLKKASDGNEESEFVSRLGDDALIGNSFDNGELTRYAGAPQLVAGTSWLFSREEMDGAVDVLVIDEAR